jgi:hypothetical protein
MGRISALQEYKTQATRNAADFNKEPTLSGKNSGISSLKDSWTLSGSLTRIPWRPIEVGVSPTLVARIYAVAAFINVHVVASGFQR